MDVLKEYQYDEIFIKNSKFLTEAFPVNTQQEARNLLKKQKTKYQDATHVVHSFVIGNAGEILGCSDDGEPSGTAGKPSLSVLTGANITNIIITITRWFGGTLLGTGGLVKAYGDATKKILLKVKREELIQKSKFYFRCSYNEYEFIKRNIDIFSVEIHNTDFSEFIEINGTVPNSKKEALHNFIKNITKGHSVKFKD